MRVMCRTFFNGPILHRARNNIGDFKRKRKSFLNRFFQRSVCILGKSFLHNAVIKNITAKYFRHINLFRHKPRLLLFLKSRKSKMHAN